ncbi:MAG: glycoside hydrolase family 97 N-terminal domain-containing protein [Hymenobacter sp.]
MVLPAGRQVTTPWRIVMIADRPEQLVENRMVQRLAAPSRIADTTWIKPGKAAWGWWSGLLPRYPECGAQHGDLPALYRLRWAHGAALLRHRSGLGIEADG